MGVQKLQECHRIGAPLAFRNLMVNVYLQAVFVGHNHGLDWCCPSGSMHLCFARHTGYGGYGSWIRGTRIVELVESPVFQIKTWVTLEDGSVVSSLLL
jgi:hypothetical protein